MSAKTDALESAVTTWLQARTALDASPSPRARATADRAFAHLAALAAPRIRYFTRRYGLSDVGEDAEQAGAIALHRAAERYDPTRARFTTYVNWQIRAEMQALRQRMRGGPQAAALSLDALCDAGADDWLADPVAEAATEEAASYGLAALCADRLVAEWAERRRHSLGRQPRHAQPARLERKIAAECAIVRHLLLDVEAVATRLREADRHIVRRALADIARHEGAKPH